jgi:hypothetical protein
MRFVPYGSAAEANVVVDGSPNAATVLTLSHWPGLSAPPETWADTSAEMALRYLDLGAGRHGDAEIVTNNHFDQDGLAGVFALVDPAAALARRDLLLDVARAGDFAAPVDRRAARVSMTISAWAREAAEAPYDDQCADLYTDALGRFTELLDAPDRFRDVWGEEDAWLTAAERAVAGGLVEVHEIADLDLAVVGVDDSVDPTGGHRFGGRWADGVHPMALHRATPCVRLLVAHGRSYRYTDRYETWVQYRSRPLPRRIDLRPVADELAALETGAATWSAAAPGDLTPELVPDEPSSLDLPAVEAVITRALRTARPAWDPYRPG